ncbi:MAG: hypothetical protein AAF393_00050 [Pseudomonadota bacterium]
MNGLLKAAILGLAVCGVGPAYAQNTSETEAAETAQTLPALSTRFEEWSTQAFTFEGSVTNMRRSSPEFNLRMGKVSYSTIFDAGRAKRTAVLDCLDLSDACDIRGEAFLVFEGGKMVVNITDITWLSIPEIDFDEKAARLHRCVKNAQRKERSFAAVVELRLNVLDLERSQAWDAEVYAPREGGRGPDMVLKALNDCFRTRFRLPVGAYRVKVFTQSAETFLWTWEE